MKKLLNFLRTMPAQARAIPRNVRLFLFTVFVYALSVEGINAVLLNLYLVRLGYGTEFIGALNSAGMLIFALVSLPIGAIKWLSSRQMLLIGLVLSTLGIIGIGLSIYATTAQAGLLIAFRIMSMVGLSCYFVHQLPFAMEITRPAWHDRVLSLSMAAFSLAAFLGSWIGGMMPQFFANILAVPLSNPAPYQLPILVAAILTLPAILALRALPDGETIGFTPEDESSDSEARAKQSSIKPGWRSMAGLVAIILIVRALQTSGVGVLNTFYNVYFDVALNVPTDRIGLVNGLGRLLGVPMSLLIPLFIARFKHFRLVIISLMLIVVLMVPFALISYWPISALAFMSISSMGSLRYLSFLGFTMSLVPENQRSLMSGAGEMAIGTGFALSSFMGGYLIAWYGYREVFLFGATLTAIGTVAFWAIFRKRAASMALAAQPVT